MAERFFVVGYIRMNKSKRSLKIHFESGYRTGIVSRNELLGVLEGKLDHANITVFKNYFLMRERSTGQSVFKLKDADPEKFSLSLELEP